MPIRVESCFVFTPYCLSEGCKGLAVVALQLFLKAFFLCHPKLSADLTQVVLAGLRINGVYDQATAEVVKDLQAVLGRDRSGVLCPMTRCALRQQYGISLGSVQARWFSQAAGPKLRRIAIVHLILLASGCCLHRNFFGTIDQGWLTDFQRQFLAPADVTTHLLAEDEAAILRFLGLEEFFDDLFLQPTTFPDDVEG